jgi:hypothetical protein
MMVDTTSRPFSPKSMSTIPEVYTPMEALRKAMASPDTQRRDARNKLHGREYELAILATENNQFDIFARYQGFITNSRRYDAGNLKKIPRKLNLPEPNRKVA